MYFFSYIPIIMNHMIHMNSVIQKILYKIHSNHVRQRILDKI